MPGGRGSGNRDGVARAAAGAVQGAVRQGEKRTASCECCHQLLNCSSCQEQKPRLAARQSFGPSCWLLSRGRRRAATGGAQRRPPSARAWGWLHVRSL